MKGSGARGYQLFFACLLALGLAACGSSGGGGAAGSGTVAGTNFTAVPLAGIGGTFSAGVAINDNGMAVGVADNGTGLQAVKWTITDAAPAAVQLSPLPGGGYSAAYGVDDLGVAVGESESAAGIVAVVWAAGSTTPTALNRTGLLAGGHSAAYGINEQGRIVGEAANDNAGNTAAVLWPSATAAPVLLQGLSAAPGSCAFNISDQGVIVGESRNAAGRFQAVVWRETSPGAYGAPTPLAAAAVEQVASAAYDTDSAGNIVGEAELPGGVVHGVVWNAAGAVAGNLGANSSAQAVNDFARIVGYTAAGSGSELSAVWHLLNPDDKKDGAAVSQLFGVNNLTQAVGVSGSQAHAVIPQ